MKQTIHGVLTLLLSLSLPLSAACAQNPSLSPPASPAGKTDTTPAHTEPERDGVLTLWNKYQRLGARALELGDLNTAASMYKQALEEAIVLGDKDPHVTVSLQMLAGVYLRQENFTEAVPLYRQAVEITETAGGADSSALSNALLGLAQVYIAQKDYSSAEPVLKRALELAEKSGTAGNGNDRKLAIMASLADLYQYENKVSEAESIYKQIESDPPHGAASADALESYGLFLYRANRLSEAEAVMQKVLSIKEGLPGGDAGVAVSLNNLAELYRNEGKPAEAEPLYAKALAIWEKVAPNTRDHAAVLSNLSLTYKAEGKYTEAKPLMVKALSIDQRLSGPFAEDVALDLANLASIHECLNEPGEARLLYEQALPVLEKKLGADSKVVQDTKKQLENLKSKTTASSAPAS